MIVEDAVVCIFGCLLLTRPVGCWNPEPNASRGRRIEEKLWSIRGSFRWVGRWGRRWVEGERVKTVSRL